MNLQTLIARSIDVRVRKPVVLPKVKKDFKKSTLYEEGHPSIPVLNVYRNNTFGIKNDKNKDI